jgi:hypothetical protein
MRSAIQGLGVGVKMFQQENAQRHDAGQLMEFAQDKSPAQIDRQARTPPLLSLGGKAIEPNSGRL